MGKRRVAIEKVNCPKARNVCFTKRRKGLFKKAAELSGLHNLRIAAVAFSPAGTPFEFGNTSLLFDRYIAAAAACGPSSSSSASASASDSVHDKYNRYRISEITNLLDVDVSSLTVTELKGFSSDLEKLRSHLWMSLQENQEDEILGNNEIQTDGFGLTLDEILSKIIEEDDDSADFGFEVEGNFELAKKQQEIEAMVRELLADDADFIQEGSVSTEDFMVEGVHGDGEFDDCFAGLSAEEFINELLNL